MSDYIRRWTFSIGGLDEKIEIQAMDIHTALFRLGSIILREHKSHVQPGLTITLKELKGFKKSVSEIPKDIKASTTTSQPSAVSVAVDTIGRGGTDGLDERTEGNE